MSRLLHIALVAACTGTIGSLESDEPGFKDVGSGIATIDNGATFTATRRVPGRRRA